MAHSVLPFTGRLLLAAGFLGAAAGCSKRESAPQPPAQTAAVDSTPSPLPDTSGVPEISVAKPGEKPSSAAAESPAVAPAESTRSSQSSASPMTVTRKGRPQGVRLKRDTAATAAAPSPAPPANQPAAGASKSPPGDQWVSFDPATNTVTFKLVAGPFSFNGYTNGGATLTVPPKSTVVINFSQDDGTPHSAEVASGEGPVPNAGGDPAIPKAYTNKVVEGLPQGATDVMRFTAPESGSYRIACGVPGHALSGMWIWLKVDPAAKSPTFAASK